MKKYILLLLYSFFLLHAIAQKKTTSEIKGKVLFQNSKKQPAIHVKVNGGETNYCYSKSTGDFALRYLQKVPGDPAGLSIVPKDINNVKLELANSDLVHKTKIPNDPDEDFYIFVFKVGEKKKLVTHYVDICSSPIDKKFKALIKEKETQILKANPNQKYLYQSELDSIKIKYKEEIQLLKGYANEIASINRDFAFDLINAAIDKVEKDHDIKGAIKILDSTKLDNEYKKIIEKKKDEINKQNSKIIKIVEGYELLISFLRTEFKYDAITIYYKKIIQMYEANDIDNDMLILYYINLGDAYGSNGDYTKKLDSEKKALGKCNVTTSAPIALFVLDVIGHSYSDLLQFDSSLVYYKKALVNSTESNDSTNLLYLATLYQGLGEVYRRMDSLPQSLEMNQKAISYKEKTQQGADLSMSKLYHGLSMTYLRLLDFEEALKYAKLSFRIKDSLLKPNNPSLADAYQQLSWLSYMNLNSKEALQYIYKAKNINENALHPLHPDLASIYDMLARIYESNKTPESIDSAIHYYKKSAFIRSSPPNKVYDQKTAYTNLVRAMALKAKLQGNELRSIAILDSAIRFCQPNDFDIISDLASYYYNVNEFDSSIRYYEQALLLGGKTQHQMITENLQSKILNVKASKYFEQQDFLTAGKYFDTIVHYFNPNNLVQNFKLAFCYYVIKQYDSAIIYYDKSLALTGKSPDKATYDVIYLQMLDAKAKKYSFEKNYASSIVYFDSLYALNKDLETLYDIAYEYYDQKNYLKSIEIFKKVVFLDTLNSKKFIQSGLGLAYANTGNLTKAEEAFRLFENLKLDTGRIYRNHAVIFILKGQVKNALSSLQKAIDHGYNNLDFLKNDEILNLLRNNSKFKKMIATLENK